MCVIGGFLGAYALLCRAENFGNAQTTNLIQILFCLTGKNFVDFSLRIAGLALYAGAILLFVYLSRKTACNMQKYAITIDIAGMILLSAIPADCNPIIGLLPLFFMMASQWCVFHGTDEYNSSTIFSTNNLKQTVLAFGEYLLQRDPKQLKKAKFFANSLLWYHIGVAASIFCCHAFGIHASLCAIPAAVLASGFIFYSDIVHLFRFSA
ncbi:MAG: DUF1275 domain-containing protein [Clostridiaceae bacterium]|nr:DUF1275 domain-containing protein [Clostridiaceae bacterium]